MRRWNGWGDDTIDTPFRHLAGRLHIVDRVLATAGGPLWLAQKDHLPRKLKQTVRVSYEIKSEELWTAVTINADIPDDRFACFEVAEKFRSSKKFVAFHYGGSAQKQESMCFF